jgi:hypothetical protein
VGGDLVADRAQDDQVAVLLVEVDVDRAAVLVRVTLLARWGAFGDEL